MNKSRSKRARSGGDGSPSKKQKVQAEKPSGVKTQLKLSQGLQRLHGTKYCVEASLTKETMIARLKELKQVKECGTKKRSHLELCASLGRFLFPGDPATATATGKRTSATLPATGLLAHLKALKEVAVVDTITVQVQTPSSASFRVTIDTSDDSVRALKEAIRDEQGTQHYLQELYPLAEKDEGKGQAEGQEEKDLPGSSTAQEAGAAAAPGSAAGGETVDTRSDARGDAEPPASALADDAKVSGPCSVLLLVKVETPGQRCKRECAERRAKIVVGEEGLLEGTGESGCGKVRWSDGATYDGQWREYLKHGEGTYVAADGAQYKGQWRDDVKHGEGVMAMATGSVYIGQFDGGRPHGAGRYDFSDGASYQGPFERGSMSGARGTFVFGTDGWGDDEDDAEQWDGWVRPGDRYEGPFVRDKFNGVGEWTHAEGGGRERIETKMDRLVGWPDRAGAAVGAGAGAADAAAAGAGARQRQR